MTKEMREQIERLRALAPKLNAKVEQANLSMQAAESLLVEELSLGVTAQSKPFEEIEQADPCGEDDGYERWDFAHLAYGRVSGKYRLHVLRTVERRNRHDEYAVWEVLSAERVAWSSCPNAEKVAAYVKLPELLEIIADKTAKVVEQADATDQEMRDIFGDKHPAARPPTA